MTETFRLAGGRVWRTVDGGGRRRTTHRNTMNPKKLCKRRRVSGREGGRWREADGGREGGRKGDSEEGREVE